MEDLVRLIAPVFGIFGSSFTVIGLVYTGMQGGGGQLSGAIAMIVGGLIVMVAAGYFSTIDWGTVSGH